MVYDEYRSIQGGMGSSDQYRWNKPAALRAFQGLAACGLTAYTAGGSGGGSRMAGRGAAYAAAELRCGRQTLDTALKALGGSCPDLLYRFFKMEV